MPEHKLLHKVTLVFDNLDNSLYTDHQATMFFEIKADDFDHVILLAEKLKKVFDADDFYLD